VDVGLVLAIVMALAYALFNGVNDAAAAVAMPVTTRAARPGRVLAVAAVFNFLGPFVLGTAVAGTIAGIVAVQGDEGVAVVGAGLTSAVTWCGFGWWQGLPTSAGHALIGGLAGAAIAAEGLDGVTWGGLDGWKPYGVLGALFALVFSVVLGLASGAVVDRLARRALRRSTHEVLRPVKRAEVVSAAALALGHGANDAQKSLGAIVALLVASGESTSSSPPFWATVAAAAALTLGTALGGWPIVRTIGHRLVRVRPVEGLVAQGSSAFVVVASSIVGAPVSTTQVLVSSVVGTGVGRHRGRHVRWAIAGRVVVSWLVTLPVAAMLAVAFLPLWRLLS
jgi:PiT family inorganic phosphate transporter